MTDPQYTPTTRVCSKCHEEKPLTAYYPSERSPLGRKTTCGACIVARRKSDPEYILRRRELDRLRIPRKARRRDPEKSRTRQKLQRAIKAGMVVRPSICHRCGGGGPIEAHHHDYSRPLDVEWLCKPCHRERHHGPLPPPLPVPVIDACANGHERTTANTRPRVSHGKSWRVCIDCEKARNQRKKARYREQRRRSMGIREP